MKSFVSQPAREVDLWFVPHNHAQENLSVSQDNNASIFIIMLGMSCSGHIGMVVSKSDSYISPEEYLEGEKVSLVNHEYIQGKVYAMAGASDAQNPLTSCLVKR